MVVDLMYKKAFLFSGGSGFGKQDNICCWEEFMSVQGKI